MNKHIHRLMRKKIAFVGSEYDGMPYIKAMLVSKREGENVFYFDSNNGAQRTAHWLENPSACVYFHDIPIYRGVMLSGEMEVINDIELKRKHWQPAMKRIYQGGPDDPDYCILKFTAFYGRYYYMLESEDFELGA